MFDKKPSSLIDYVQIATGLAVVAGLILVVYELRLSREIAQAQLMDNTYLSILDDARQRLGENFSDIEAKACLTPELLTDGEIAAMNNFYSSYLNRTSRLVRLSEYFEEFDISVERQAVATLIATQNSEFGRRWLESTLSTRTVQAETRAVVTRMAEELPEIPINCADFYTNLRSHFSPADTSATL